MENPEYNWIIAAETFPKWNVPAKLFSAFAAWIALFLITLATGIFAITQSPFSASCGLRDEGFSALRVL